MTVMEKGTQNGTTTDADGNYLLNLSSASSAVEFNALGYKAVTEQVAGRSVINITAQEEAIALDAVVAIGYGTVRKRDLTTAVSTVSNEDMQLRPVTEASGFIQGKVAGVTVQQTSGLPGSGMTVRVRGASSIASSNDPLYVVDGVPVGTGNYAIAYLSPQDIETMQILKDASSAAIYGSRAANGVVLITTKQGKKSRGPQITLNASVGLANVARTYEVLNVEEYRELMDELGAISLPDGLKDETDWFKETYRTGINQNYQISVSNANDKMRYYLSGGYSDEKGILPVPTIATTESFPEPVQTARESCFLSSTHRLTRNLGAKQIHLGIGQNSTELTSPLLQRTSPAPRITTVRLTVSFSPVTPQSSSIGHSSSSPQ